MEFLGIASLFLLPAILYSYLTMNILLHLAKVELLMSKVLFVVAKGHKKEKHTSANDDFLNNFNRSEDQPDKEEISSEEVISDSAETTISEQQNITDTPINFSEGDKETTPSENFFVKRIDSILQDVQTLTERVKNMALNLDVLTAEVSRARTVQASAVALIQKVAAELESVSADLASAQHEPPVDTSAIDALAADLKASTDALASAVADSVDVTPTQTVIVNSDNPEVPTAEVILPVELPAVVTTTVEQIVETVDPASPEPQVQIVVEAAPAPVVDAVEAAPAEVVADPAQNITTSEGQVLETGVVETDAGQTDVTVAVPVEEAAVAEAAGVDVVDTVAQAYEQAPEVVAVPEAPVEPTPAPTE